MKAQNMKAQKKKGHKLAAAFMAVAVAASVPLGINRSLERLRDDISGSYYYDQGGYAIYEGIEARQEAASDLITLAERYVDKAPSLKPYIDELEYRVQISRMAYDDNGTFTSEAAANAALDGPAGQLAAALDQVELQEKDRKYPAQLLANMSSEQDKINRSSYNSDAEEFNRKVKGLKPLAIVEPMAVFSGQAAEEAAPEDTGVIQVEDTAAEERSIPSPPEAPEAPAAPDVDSFARSMGELGKEIGGSAEELAGNISRQVEDGVGGFVDGIVDGILDGIFGG